MSNRIKEKVKEAGQRWLPDTQQMNDADRVKAFNPNSQEGEKDVNTQ